MDSTEPDIGANESTREIIEKIFCQNSQINAKLDEILAKQQVLEERIDQIEVDYEETNVDEAFANIIKFYIYIMCLLNFFSIYLGYHQEYSKKFIRNFDLSS